MKKLVLLLLVGLLPGIGHAVICKTIAADGTVSYADLPPEACPKPLKLPDYSRYKPRVATPPQSRDQQPSDASASPSEQQAPAPFTGYRSMRFDQPSPGETLRSNSGTVPVSLVLEPQLQAGHRIRIKLDGLYVDGSFTGTSIQLSNVPRGTHTLSATVFDADGRALISASGGPFTLRKPSLQDPNRRPDDGDGNGGTGGDGDSDGGGDSEPYAPGSGSNYGPGSAADYSPGGEGIPTTPGRTNPAYAPAGGGIPTTPGRTNPAYRPAN